MRLWLVDPSKMCSRHLLGEHCESHMFVGTLNKGKSVNGYILEGLLEVHSLKRRHDELAQEMVRRGFSHKSPLPEFKEYTAGSIDVSANEAELKKRCTRCKF